jgi:hypothetical protein
MNRISVRTPEEDRLLRTGAFILERFVFKGSANINIEG